MLGDMSLQLYIVLTLVGLSLTSCTTEHSAEKERRPRIDHGLDAGRPDFSHDVSNEDDEQCNGLDDDQDGYIDEDFAVGDPCSTVFDRCL